MKMARTLASIAWVLFLSSTVSLAQDFPATSLMACAQPASTTTAAKTDATLTVPADTEASVQLLSGLHTQVAHVDDPASPGYSLGRSRYPSSIGRPAGPGW